MSESLALQRVELILPQISIVSPEEPAFLDKQGSSNLAEQQAVLSPSLGLLSAYEVVVLGDREFCSPKLGKWLGEAGTYFCLRQKSNTNVRPADGLYQALREYGLKPGMKLFLNDQEITKSQGFGTFNVAAKWKRTYRAGASHVVSYPAILILMLLY